MSETVLQLESSIRELSREEQLWLVERIVHVLRLCNFVSVNLLGVSAARADVGCPMNLKNPDRLWKWGQRTRRVAPISTTATTTKAAPPPS